MSSPLAAKRPPLSRERILAVALAIADREGLEAISMRRVGDELGVEAMSLYNHVTNKAALLDGIFEAILAELPAVERSGSWRAIVRARATDFRAVLKAHPNALPLFATRPAVTPASIAHVETMLAVLRDVGLSPRNAVAAMQVVIAFVVGHILATHSPRRADDDARPAYANLDEASFPRVREAARILPSYDLDHEFRFGLDLLLDGLARRLERGAVRR